MSLSISDLQVPVMATVVIAIAAVVVRLFETVAGEQGERRRKKVSAIKDQLSQKLSAGIIITAKDVFDIGRGLGASQSASADAIYQLFADSDSSITIVPLIVVGQFFARPFLWMPSSQRV